LIDGRWGVVTALHDTVKDCVGTLDASQSAWNVSHRHMEYATERKMRGL